MRWDQNGDGDPDATTTAADYLLAFPDRETSATGTMGCPSGNCTGYELTTDLTFAATSTWTPIADFAATLDGAGHTITGLSINTGAIINAGMFSALTASATIRDLGLIDAHVTSTVPDALSHGILAGSAAAGSVISGVYAQGGRITATTTSGGVEVGGLVGELQGAIRASYATASVNIPNSNLLASYAGGLVGRCTRCTITASYAAGPVASTGAVNTTNGLVGGIDSDGINDLTNSYCDTQATGQANCISPTGNPARLVLATAANTAGLQTPTGYTGLYLNWNIDTNDDGLPNYPWNFRTATQYPVLYTPTERAAVTPTPMDYDADDNDQIEIHTIAQLNALRWDTDGDGRPTSANAPAYSTVFAGHTVGMGCDTTCNGYELAGNLTFPAEPGPYNPWTPIATYNSILDGQGHSIANLKVEHDDNAGLFATLGGSSAVRNLALINPRVTLTIYSRHAGALVGFIPAGGSAVIENIAVLGGRIAVEPATTTAFNSFYAGGLAGRVRAGATIRNSYASAEVATAFAGNGLSRLGGLVGELNGELINTYAYGPITEAAGGTNIAGGLVGNTDVTATSTASYCNIQVNPRPSWPYCIGNYHSNFGSTTTSPFEKTTAELQTPVGYTGIYETWGPADTSTPLWDFGGSSDYPRLHFAPMYTPPAVTDSPPPGGPREAQPPQDTPYDPAADHPEITPTPATKWPQRARKQGPTAPRKAAKSPLTSAATKAR